MNLGQREKKEKWQWRCCRRSAAAEEKNAGEVRQRGRREEVRNRGEMKLRRK